MKCPRCGIPIDESTEICPVCGYKFSIETKDVDQSSQVELLQNAFNSTGKMNGAYSKEYEMESPFDAPPQGIFYIAAPQEFVGHKDDLQRINEELNRVAQNNALTFITVHGPAGIGKSRLLQEFSKKASEQDNPVWVIFSDLAKSFGTSPFSSFLGALTELFGVDPESMEKDEAISQLESSISTYMNESQARETAHILAQYLGYDMIHSDVLEPILASPSQMELRMFIVVRRLLASMAHEKPVIIVVDSVDRAEHENINLLHYLADGLSSNPVLIVAGGRDDLFNNFPQWAEGDYANLKLKLSQLSPDESEKLLALLLPKIEKFPKSLLSHLRERMDRSPRTITELARFLIESDIVETSTKPWRIKLSKLATTHIPPTLEGLLAARIHHLPRSDRDVLNRAATFGERFWLDGVVALIRVALYGEEIKRDPDGPSLDAITRSGDFTIKIVTNSIKRHIKRGFIEPVNTSTLYGEKEYRFSYPPIWNLVYEAIPEQERKLYHFQVAQWLELHVHGDDSLDLHEEIGRHFEASGYKDRAAAHYALAGNESRTRFLNDRAIRLYIRALRTHQLGNIGERLTWWHNLGSVYELKGEFNKALTCYEKMLRLSWLMSSRSKGGVAFNKMGRIHRSKGNLSLALEYLKKGLKLFEAAGDERGIASSKDDISQILRALGEYDEAMRYGGEALELRRKIGDPRSIAVSLNNIGLIEMGIGRFNEAASCFYEALSLRRQVRDQTGIIGSLNVLGILYFHQGKLDDALEQWSSARKLTEETGNLPMEAKLLNNMGEALYEKGKYIESKGMLERAIALAEEMQDKHVLFDAKRNLAMVMLALGHSEDALGLAQQAMQLSEELDVIEYKAMALMAVAEVLSSTVVAIGDDPQTNEADGLFQQAIDIFAMLNSETLQTKALKRYARFLVETGRENKAIEVLKEARQIAGRLGLKDLETIKKLLNTLEAGKEVSFEKQTTEIIKVPSEEYEKTEIVENPYIDKKSKLGAKKITSNSINNRENTNINKDEESVRTPIPIPKQKVDSKDNIDKLPSDEGGEGS